MRRIGYVIEGLRVNRSIISYTPGIRKHSVPICPVNNRKPMIALSGKISDIERNDLNVEKCFLVSKMANTHVEKLTSHPRFVNNSMKRGISEYYGLKEVNIKGTLLNHSSSLFRSFFINASNLRVIYLGF